MIRNVLIVCVGNICRSPIGEVLLKTYLAHIAPQVEVSSAGIAALVNEPADATAQAVIQERGLDISDHRARQLTPQIILAADLILTMEARHERQVEAMLPSVCGRVHRIGKWGGFDVIDPYRRPRIVFEQTLALIDQGIKDWQRKLWK